MTTARYQVRICNNPACGLRYPLVEGHPFGERCPLCLDSTTVVDTRPLSPEPFSPPNRPDAPRLHALLDNLRSAWNVGAIFRTADCLSVEKLYLCGITPTPENEAVRKTALGAENSVAWESARDAVKLAEKLKADGFQLWALEQDQRAAPLGQTQEFSGGQVILIVGNEVTGVDPGLLDLADRIVHIPMLGRKRSLNVEVAFGIAAWEFFSAPG